MAAASGSAISDFIILSGLQRSVGHHVTGCRRPAQPFIRLEIDHVANRSIAIDGKEVAE
jgi:hypothetical protein